MPHVVCEPCFGRKAQCCVAVCPSGAIHEGAHLVYIHPDECTDCGLCVAACPNQAIYPAEYVPDKWQDFIELNIEMAGQAPRAGLRREA